MAIRVQPRQQKLSVHSANNAGSSGVERFPTLGHRSSSSSTLQLALHNAHTQRKQKQRQVLLPVLSAADEPDQLQQQ